MKRKIILATTSPRRHSLATDMGLEFEIVPSRYEEDMTKRLRPAKMVKEFALGKAQEVAKRKEGLIIGVDTIVVFKGKKIGKPKNKKEAFRMLKSFSNRSQKVYSGVAIIDTKTNKIINDYVITKVWFRKLSDREIKNYIDTGEPMDKAGAYGIQGLSSIFIKKVSGCFFNVVGFPVYNIYKNLKKLGVDIFKYDKWQKAEFWEK